MTSPVAAAMKAMPPAVNSVTTTCSSNCIDVGEQASGAGGQVERSASTFGSLGSKLDGVLQLVLDSLPSLSLFPSTVRLSSTAFSPKDTLRDPSSGAPLAFPRAPTLVTKSAQPGSFVSTTRLSFASLARTWSPEPHAAPVLLDTCNVLASESTCTPST